MPRLKKITGNYTTVPNSWVNDEKISLKAKGLLLILQSLSDGWDFTIAGIATKSKDSVDATRTAINELRNAGYLYWKQSFDENGKFGEVVVELYEIPLLENPITENSLSENRPQTNNNITNNNKTNNKLLKKDGDFEVIFKEREVSDELKSAFLEFIQMRKAIGAKITPRGLELAIDKVRKLDSNESRQIEIINQSIEKSWRGLFPLSDLSPNNKIYEL